MIYLFIFEIFRLADLADFKAVNKIYGKCKFHAQITFRVFLIFDTWISFRIVRAVP